MSEENQQPDIVVAELTAHYMRYEGEHYFRLEANGGAAWSKKDGQGNLICESTERAAILEAALHTHLRGAADAMIATISPLGLRSKHRD